MSSHITFDLGALVHLQYCEYLLLYTVTSVLQAVSFKLDLRDGIQSLRATAIFWINLSNGTKKEERNLVTSASE